MVTTAVVLWKHATRRLPMLLSVAVCASGVAHAVSQSQTPVLTVDGDSPSDRFGYSLAVVPDTSGDGIADFIVGSREGNFARMVSGSDGATLWTRHGDSASDQFGHSVDAFGDIDNDGVNDVIVGTRGSSSVPARYARVLSGLDGATLIEMHGSAGNYGYAVTGIGDVDGDGSPDAVVGSHRSGTYGYADVVSGQKGLQETIDAVAANRAVDMHTMLIAQLYGDQTNDRFGIKVNGLGDVNADGKPDFSIGADNARQGRGRIYVFSGEDLEGLPLSATLGQPGALAPLYVTNGPAGSNHRLAHAVAAGDLNGDGWSELLMSAPQPVGGSGLVQVRDVKTGNVLHTFTKPSPQAYDYFGQRTAMADMDGDGVKDFLITSPELTSPKGNGDVWIFSGVDYSLLCSIPGEPGHGLGAQIDVYDNDGDGQDEIVVSNHSDSQLLRPTSVFVFKSCLAAADSDSDGLSDSDEAALGTDPANPDTDADGLQDGEEVNQYLTSPLMADSDGDGLSDGTEIGLQAFGGCPDPLLADTDADGLSDGTEVTQALDPCDADMDDDGLTDGLEIQHGTDPFVADTDGDGMLDGTEVDVAQGSGCPNPLDPDSDGDGLSDGDEADDLVGSVAITDPCNADTDGDGIPDDIDPLPTDPGGTEGYIAQDLRDLSDYIAILNPLLFDAPNNNARKGRRGAMSNKVSAAANAVAAGNIQEAIDELNSLLLKLDDLPKPKDWMLVGTPEKAAVVNWIQSDLALLGYL
jgi:hypothetical protein